MTRGSLILSLALLTAYPAASAEAASPSRQGATAPASLMFVEQIDSLIAAGRLDGAAQVLARVGASETPGNVGLARAEYALATGALDDASAGFTSLSGASDLAGRAQQGLGITRLRQGKIGPAVAALDAALKVNPKLTRAWIARGVAADQTRDWAGAEVAYTHALDLEPASAAALTNRGYSRLLRGNLAGSIVDLKKAVSLDPDLAAARTNLQVARAMTGDYKGALAGSTMNTVPRDLNTIGFAAMARGEYALAETYFSRAMQLNPEFDHTAWANLVYAKQLAHPAFATDGH